MGPGVEDEGTILVEGSKETGAARTAWEPHHERVFGDVVLGLEKDVMDRFVIEEVNVEVALRY